MCNREWTRMDASAYDAMGRRVKKIVSRRDAETQSWSVEETHHFFYDGWNVVRETVQPSTTNHEPSTLLYTWGNDLSGSLQGAGGVGGLLAVFCVSSNTSYLSPLTCYPLYDHNGNVERYVSRSGATAAAFQYDAFGNIVSETLTNSGTNELSNFSFRFSTKYWDAETALYYYGCRYYSPILGKWISLDLIMENGGVNLYMYVYNSPEGSIDALGQMSTVVWGAGNNSSVQSVSGFWSMIGGALMQVDEYILEEGSRVHSEILKEIIEKLEAKARAAIDCKFDYISPPPDSYTGQAVPYGGKLFSNPFSSEWGPRTYNFWTIGNASTFGETSFSARKGECCCYEVKFKIDLQIKDVFDFVPDRSVPANAALSDYAYALLYDVPAFVWAAWFNGVLEASQPNVRGDFQKEWEATICK